MVPQYPSCDTIVYVDASVRGPYLPVYFPADLHWTDIFTSAMGSGSAEGGGEGEGEGEGDGGRRVAMVGSTIRCHDYSRPKPAVERHLGGRGVIAAVETAAFAFTREAVELWKADGLLDYHPEW